VERCHYVCELLLSQVVDVDRHPRGVEFPAEPVTRVAYTSRTEAPASARRCRSIACCLTSDVVSLHVPLTPETTHLIDKRAATRMKAVGRF